MQNLVTKPSLSPKLNAKSFARSQSKGNTIENAMLFKYFIYDYIYFYDLSSQIHWYGLETLTVW